MAIVEGIEDVVAGDDMSVHDLLVSRGVGRDGIDFADVRYAQTSAVPLTRLGVHACQREVSAMDGWMGEWMSDVLALNSTWILV